MTDQSATENRPIAPGTAILSTLLRSEAIALAISTLLGYAIVFAYEAGFCWYYGIPYSLITLNLPTCFAVAGALFVGFYYFVYYTRWVVDVAKIRTEYEYRLWADRFTSFFVSGFLAIQTGMNAVAAVASGLLINTLVKRVRTASAKRRERLGHPPSQQTGLLEQHLPARYHFAAGIIALALVAVFLYGRSHATTQPQYVTHVDGDDYLVLRIYGDYLVAAPCFVQHGRDFVFLWARGKSTTLIVRHALRVFRLGDKESPKNLQHRNMLMPIALDGRAANSGLLGWVFPYENRQ